MGIAKSKYRSSRRWASGLGSIMQKDGSDSGRCRGASPKVNMLLVCEKDMAWCSRFWILKRKDNPDAGPI